MQQIHALYTSRYFNITINYVLKNMFCNIRGCDLYTRLTNTSCLLYVRFCLLINFKICTCTFLWRNLDWFRWGFSINKVGYIYFTETETKENNTCVSWTNIIEYNVDVGTTFFKLFWPMLFYRPKKRGGCYGI
jgi:hypothetical protein